VDLVSENIVVTARQFNPSLVSQLWLRNNGIVRDDEFTPDAIFTPAFVQLTTTKFNFLLIENRLQFVPLCGDDEKQGIVVERLGQLVTTIPHTPYSGVGVNFVWHYEPGRLSSRDVGKRLFFNPETPLAREFNTDDAHFGGYYSKNILGFRLKLSSTPMTMQQDNAKVEKFQFSFNYHSDVDGADGVTNALCRWSDAREHAAKLIRLIGESL
jgi:hypothetical protein